MSHTSKTIRNALADTNALLQSSLEFLPTLLREAAVLRLAENRPIIEFIGPLLDDLEAYPFRPKHLELEPESS